MRLDEEEKENNTVVLLDGHLVGVEFTSCKYLVVGRVEILEINS